MSITVADCLKLTSLREAEVVAGFDGLSNVVVSVTVLEYAVPTALTDNYFRNNEIVISAFISIKNDVEAQCATIRRLHEVGEVGLILYYIGAYLPELDPRLIETANEIGFPLICMPYGRCDLRYSEVICDVMEAIIKDQMEKTNFVGEMLDRILHLRKHQRIMSTVLRMLSDRIHSTLLLTDRTFSLLDAAAWPVSASIHIEELIDYCKTCVVTSEPSIQKIVLGENAYNVSCQSVVIDHGPNLNLIIFNEIEDLLYESCKQASEVIRLFINIWKHNEGKVSSTELMRAILNDEPMKMRRLAEIMHIDISSIHIMWVIKSNNKNGNSMIKEAANTNILIKTKEFLEEHHRLAIVDIFEGNVVAFMDNCPYGEENNSLAEEFIKDLPDDQKDITLALCTDLETTADVRAAYTLLESHLKNARIIFPHKNLLTYHEILFASNCYEAILKGESALMKELLPLKPLRSDDKEQEKMFIDTLSVYMLDTQANVEQTGQILFIHKSTVKYRINKINERLNYHVLKLPESYKLYCALAIERLLLALN